MKYLLLAALAVLSFSHSAAAQSLVEPDYEGVEPPATTPWVIYYTPENYKADMGFVTGMRPHHAGALTMSERYLASPDKHSSRLQSLAKGIIRNQTFEISMLDQIEKDISDIDFTKNGPGWYQVATKELAQRQQFMRAPTPPIQKIFSGNDTASATDVKFAKAMIAHHEGALIMCQGYLNDAAAKNGYLQRMCLDVLRDQAQEIQLMWNIIATYPEDASAINIKASMIDGMEGMADHMDLTRVNGRSEPLPPLKLADIKMGSMDRSKMDHGNMKHSMDKTMEKSMNHSMDHSAHMMH